MARTFAPEKARFAQFFGAELEHLLRRRRAAVCAQGLDSAKDGSRGFAGNRLIHNRFHQDLVRRLGVGDVNLEGSDLRDQGAQDFVAFGKVADGIGEFKSRLLGGVLMVIEGEKT